MTYRLEQIHASSLNDLEGWLAADPWPFHGEVHVTAESVRASAATGMFCGEAVTSLWFVRDDGVRVGMVRAFDLQDITPLLDLRIAMRFRGQGLGTTMLQAITTFVFDQHPELHRLGGYTRDDNVAMCRVFTKAGYELEARHRRSWPIAGGGYADSLGYAILRDDWQTRQ